MSKQLEEEAYDEHWPFSQGMGETEDREGYFFTPDQLKTYRSQLLKEQREICAEAAMQCSGVLLREQARRAIKNAPEPG